MGESSNYHSGKRLVTVKQLTGHPRYQWLTEASLRHLIFASRRRVGTRGAAIPGNGLDRALIRIGRKVLVDLDEFDRWIESHRLDSLADAN